MIIIISRTKSHDSTDLEAHSMYVTWVSSRIFFCGGRSYVGVTAEGFNSSHLKLVNALIYRLLSHRQRK